MTPRNLPACRDAPASGQARDLAETFAFTGRGSRRCASCSGPPRTAASRRCAALADATIDEIEHTLDEMLEQMRGL
jgi:hypothetical protein